MSSLEDKFQKSRQVLPHKGGKGTKRKGDLLP